MFVRALKSFNCAYSPLAVIQGELLEVDDELGKTWIAIGCAERVELTDRGIVPSTSAAPEIVEAPSIQRRKAKRA